MDRAPSDHLQTAYERRAELQYAAPVDLPDRRADRKFARMLDLVAETLPADSLLDAGCGDGRFLAAIARLPSHPSRLTGCDISQRILTTAAQTLAREHVEAEFTRANLEHLPLADASFDRVLCVQVIEHLLDPLAGIRELARVLRPGGELVLSTDNSKNHISRLLNLPRTVAVRTLHLTGKRAKVEFPHFSFTCDEVVAAVHSAGLAVEHVETFRFHLDGISAPSVGRFLNAIDQRSPAHHWGDIVAVVARKPPSGQMRAVHEPRPR
jgi:2-polyprenyl-3-methyl-5-hydroxy-6-metoxy-1,4-benzoquinol methylase